MHLLSLEAQGRAYYAMPAKIPQPAPSREAFEILKLYHNAVFHASISFFSEPNRVYSAQYFKRFEERNCPTKRKVNIARGYYRNWMLRSVVIAADHCYFYGCGNIDRIAQLLHYLVALGDNTRIGWGTIHSWHIEPTPDDHSLVKDGKAMRPIPVRLLESYNDAVELAWKPPYWAADSIELCAPPGAEVKLK
jgi:CRISPR type IV-associated protein Csf3